MEKTSTTMSPKKAIDCIEGFESIDEVREFIAGDDRGPVIQAASQRMLALDAGASVEPQASSDMLPAKKNPKNWRHWKYHTVRFAEDEDEPMYVDKVILGTQINAKGEQEDVTIVHRQQRGKEVPNVLTAVVQSWLDQVETRFKQKKKGGKNGGMVMVPRRVKVRDFQILESYDVKKPVEEVERMLAEQEEDAPDAGVAED
jgi:hypothetical protein